jgi:1,4-dihydroxy-2-naphthoate octaprenyltransferase
MEELQQYREAIITYVDEDGYPFSYPSDFETENGRIIIKQPKIREAHVSVLFNHITPLPTGGYTDRRYVIFWGILKMEKDRAVLQPIKSYGWDEKKIHFVQYCEESIPRARRYLKLLEEKIG